MNSDRAAHTRQMKINLPRYLEELSILLGRPVAEDELESVAEATRLREHAIKFNENRCNDFEILFDELRKNRFLQYIKNLDKMQDSSVLIWTPRTIICGPIRISNLGSVNWSFDFDINDEGMLAFSTDDMRERLILDFSSGKLGSRILHIEAVGPQWHTIEY